MSLTSAQMVDVRRFMGYQAVGTTMPITAQQDLVYGFFGMVQMSLYTRLTTLTSDEEVVLINTYLVNLNTLETAIVGTSANLDTDQAAVWFHNKRERQDREALFDSWRRRLCGFIGFGPGPDLGGSFGAQLVRS
jgi:hypothetical protein